MDEIEELAKLLAGVGEVLPSHRMIAKMLIDNGYSRHKPGRGLDEKEVVSALTIAHGDHYDGVMPHDSRRIKEIYAPAICARFAAPSLPTVEMMLKIYHDGCRDGVPRAIFNKIHALLTNPGGGK